VPDAETGPLVAQLASNKAALTAQHKITFEYSLHLAVIARSPKDDVAIQWVRG
jgi:hypothetical protein